VNDRVAREWRVDSGAVVWAPVADETCCEIGSNQFFGAFPAALIGGNHANVRPMLNCSRGRGLGIIEGSMVTLKSGRNRPA
jgi:hypothetical protein